MKTPLKGEFTFFCKMEKMPPQRVNVTYVNVSQFTKATGSAVVQC